MDINSNDNLGPASIVKQFSSKRESVKTLLTSIVIFFVTSLGIILLSYGLFLLIGKVLEPWANTPGYVNIIFASCLFLFLFWPIACLVMIAVSCIGITFAATRAIIKGDFVDFSHFETIVVNKNVSPISSEEVQLLLGEKPHTTLDVSSLKVADRPADWHSVRTTRGTFAILRVKLPYTTTPIVVNSLIEDSDIIPDTVKNGIMLDINDQVSRYFKITTVVGAEQEVYELLTPDALWELLVELDTCDILFNGGYVYYIWPEYLRVRLLFDGRAQTVEKFTLSIIRNLHNDTTFAEHLVFKYRHLLLNSLNAIIKSALWLAFLLSVAIGVFAFINGLMANNGLYIFGSPIYAIIVFIPGLLLSLCLMFSLALFFVSFRTGQYVLLTAMSLSKIKKYATYYQGRV